MIDVTGRYVMPGVIDVHVHPVYLDDVEASARCAAYGGTTTVLHFAYARTGESLEEQVTKMLEDATRRSPLDFGLHGGMFEAPRQVPEIPRVMELGVRTFKFFLTYLKQGWYTDDYQLIKAMDMLAERGGMAMVHAENGGAIDYLEDKYLKGPNASAKYFNASRPAALEEEAVFRAICLAEVAGCPLYIPHVTAGRVLRPIRQAQAEGRQVYAETCPQYLALTEEILNTRGAFAKIGPPIRTAADNGGPVARAGGRHAVGGRLGPRAEEEGPARRFPRPGVRLATDRDAAARDLGRGRERRAHRPGAAGAGAVRKPGRASSGCTPRRARSRRAATRTSSCSTRTGPLRSTDENQHTNVGYTLYEGRTVLGWPEMSFQRGQPVLWEGEIVAAPGCGRFLPTMESPAAAV